MAEHPDCFGLSVSHTTRAPRPGEIPGYHYHFSTKEGILSSSLLFPLFLFLSTIITSTKRGGFFWLEGDMERGIANNEFLETALVHGNFYGTSKKAVDNVVRLGKVSPSPLFFFFFVQLSSPLPLLSLRSSPLTYLDLCAGHWRTRVWVCEEVYDTLQVRTTPLSLYLSLSLSFSLFLSLSLSFSLFLSPSLSLLLLKKQKEPKKQVTRYLF